MAFTPGAARPLPGAWNGAEVWIFGAMGEVGWESFFGFVGCFFGIILAGVVELWGF